MIKLIQKIKTIPKPYFTFSDIRKIAGLDDPSLKIALNRLVKSGELQKITKGVYTLDLTRIGWPNFACARYYPSYLSFEWALGQAGILSQQAYTLTLATPKRSHHISTPRHEIVYHHLQEQLFWGYTRQDNFFVATPEKAFLDLAYLSLNGYAKFDPEEMNLHLLNRSRLKDYLKKFKRVCRNEKLENLVRKI